MTRVALFERFAREFDDVDREPDPVGAIGHLGSRLILEQELRDKVIEFLDGRSTEPSLRAAARPRLEGSVRAARERWPAATSSAATPTALRTVTADLPQRDHRDQGVAALRGGRLCERNAHRLLGARFRVSTASGSVPRTS